MSVLFNINVNIIIFGCVEMVCFLIDQLIVQHIDILLINNIIEAIPDWYAPILS